ncbi:MAG: cytochrome C oxidase Cbb3 [Bacteroidetes bacterium GWF2_41_31]|nr:MAG: cytochrome C oxidase Cbb3 [Bacteroidetes bacterium GWF2_41_31]OFZ08976.1 MAG: cytochrome C oxidase Cbb3 [Bacteroidetes bacterium RIFOXYB12_FULL_41_6]
MELQKFTYDNKLSNLFLWATVIWGVVGMLVGLIAALELIFPQMSGNLPWLVYSRIRPLHTNAVIFAFVGNGIFTAVYYSMPRLLKTPMYSKLLGGIHFWGWQLIIVLAALTLPFGFTQSKEYAELIWPIDVLVVLIWVVFGLNMIMTLVKRRVKHIYVSIWFYLATWVTIAVLYITNNLVIPTSFTHSYPIYAGIQDALVQWWYGHNAVAFFLTTPILGMMYYFIPKAANRPIYSYKLSIIHFWALIFLYIWAGPHHLLYSALPDWAQALGVVFSVMLIAPSWGGMINGLLTLRGAWDKVREDPVLKMFVVAVTAYGMATFEGPMLSLKTVNAMSHFTDWTIAHVHIGTLGWNSMMNFGMIYWLVPRLFNTKLWSTKLANVHFWIATLGMLFFSIPLYFAGFTQALMWKQFTTEGFLAYPNFLETVTQILPMYYLRAFGGSLYIIGALMFVYNVVKTAQAGSFVRFEHASAPAKELPKAKEGFHRRLEGRPLQFTLAALVVILIGGLLEIVPMYLVKENVPTISAVKPYTPLELEGRDIYIREGCYLCHSQMIRPFRSETERYGEYTKAGETVYDHPFLFGSKRTGPDLSREGEKTLPNYKPNSWHFNHMQNPRKMSPGSIMPAYPWLIENEIDLSHTVAKINAMIKLGVPYGDGYADQAVADLNAQAEQIVVDLQANGIQVDKNKEIIALIAYLQRLGTDVYKNK